MSEEYKPSFTMTEEISNLAIEISEMIALVEKCFENTMHRKANRIQSIQSSLAIESNKLTINQVSQIIDGRRVLGPPKDIREVQNIYEVYEMLSELSPYVISDLLTAHQTMMLHLVEEAGVYGSKAGGVYAGETLIHAGTPPQYVPGLIAELFQWLEESALHPLIKSCIFHYEFEFIHPFADGNGRTGRMWHTLILAKWKEFFLWLPIESRIHERQEEYYEAINLANSQGESTVFVKFMLEIIKKSMEMEIEKSSVNEMEDTFAESKSKKENGLVLCNVKKLNLWNWGWKSLKWLGKKIVEILLTTFVIYSVIVLINWFSINQNERDSIDKINIGVSREYVEDTIGSAPLQYVIDDNFIERYYITSNNVIRVLYENDSVVAYFITNITGENLYFGELTESYLIYDVIEEGFAANTIQNHVKIEAGTSGPGKYQFYNEIYGSGSYNNYYTIYYSILNYGECDEIQSELITAAQLLLMDEDYSPSNQVGDRYLIDGELYTYREECKPNTIGVVKYGYEDRLLLPSENENYMIILGLIDIIQKDTAILQKIDFLDILNK